MTINAQIKSDIKDAMRARNTVKRNTLRNIQTVVKQIEVDERREVTNTDMEAILMKYAKQREDAMSQFAEAGRNDLVEKEQAELDIIKTYLPEQMDDAELEATLKEIIAQIGATSMKDMGKVMGSAKKAIGSKADGGRINACVKTLLG
ncbi:MAG TPA: GatB/YqeY domain-containing protein [Campylobacterales bacterium]|nr:GatB/YqeY domain-containing protein [Campylobacterales bacterium]